MDRTEIQKTASFITNTWENICLGGVVCMRMHLYELYRITNRLIEALSLARNIHIRPLLMSLALRAIRCIHPIEKKLAVRN